MKKLAILIVLVLTVPGWAQDESPPPQEQPPQQEQTADAGPPGPEAEPVVPPPPPPRNKPVENRRQVLDEVVARVNNRIITLSELREAHQSLRQEISRQLTGADLETKIGEMSKDTLRGMIDVQLLVQYGTDRGYSVESDVLQQLDRIRQNMNLDSMEALERAMLSEGVAIEDYKETLREQFMQDLVIQRDVARSVFLDDESVEEYYEENKEELVQPESVSLREILVSTATRTVEEAADRTREILKKIRKGDDFVDLAREYSDASTAERGGTLGVFDPATLSEDVRNLIVNLLEGGVADPQLTPEGYLILQLVERIEAGVPEMERARGEIMNRMYQKKMQPAFREFLNRLRRENYVYVKAGYADSGAVPEEEKPVLRGKDRRKAQSAN